MTNLTAKFPTPGGLSLIQVISDDKHYRPFVCCICVKVVAIFEALVSNDCSHVYCKGCLQRHVIACQQKSDSNEVTCPQCERTLLEEEEEDDDDVSDDVDLGDEEDEFSESRIRARRQRRKRRLEMMQFATGRSQKDVVWLTVQPLQDSQPLAYQCLCWIQVACLGSHNKRCHWTGNYEDYQQHLTTCGAAAAASGKTTSNTMPPHQSPRDTTSPRFGALKRTQSMPALFKDQLPPNPISPHLHDDILHSPLIESSICSLDHQSLSTPPVLFRRATSMRELSKGGQSQSHENQNSQLDAFSDRSPAVPRWEAGGTTNGKKKNKKINDPLALSGHTTSYVGTAENAQTIMARDIPPSLVKRTKSHITSPGAGQETGAGAVRRNTEKPVPRDKQLRKSGQGRPPYPTLVSEETPALAGATLKSPTPIQEDATGVYENSLSSEGMEAELVANGAGLEKDLNTSINSFTAWGGNNSSSALQTMAGVSSRQILHGEQQTSHTKQSENDSIANGSSALNTDSPRIAEREQRSELLARAEKLKKQANAKFNKGDFNAARALYTQGIKIMSAVSRIGPKEGEMLSNMHSNRAVTYFREKDFISCINDCDVAIQYDPYYEKSWIRKWRALMALGKFQVALECLESGTNSLPESAKIRKELQKAKAEMALVEKSKELLHNREYKAVKDLLKVHMGSSGKSNGESGGVTDNIALLHVAARADAYMGNMDASMEKVNRALRYNPNQADGLAVRGAILYLAGETEKGLHLLQDAYGRDKENKSIKLELQQCHRTHTSLSTGRSCVKRGRYLEAVEHFTAAMKEKTLVPEKTPLYAMVRCERAEAMMLSHNLDDALRDCEDVIAAQPENAPAWTVRAEILISLGKAQEAQEELMHIRRTWGADDPTIEEGYRRVDFELRVLKAEDELDRFVLTLDQELGQVRPSRRASNDSAISQGTSRRSGSGRKGADNNERGNSDPASKSPGGGQRRPDYNRVHSDRRLSGDSKKSYNQRHAADGNREPPSTPSGSASRSNVKEKRKSGQRRSTSNDRVSSPKSDDRPQTEVEPPQPKSPQRRQPVKKSRSSRRLAGSLASQEGGADAGGGRRKLERRSGSSRVLVEKSKEDGL